MEEVTEPTQSQLPSLEDLAPLFPAYEFEGFIAEGGMGAVYMARQKSLDRPVAIKILQRELSADPEFRASFEAEAKAMARLNHSNLIGVYDFGDADGMLFIVMEMVNGKSLHHSAYGRTIDPVQAGTLVGAISRGLAHAHSAGILHRDIKPGNILLDSEANPKIGDFGLAQPMDQKTGEDEQIYGTPGYTAPEVYHRQVDLRSDIFSVGILLHELLTGKLPDGSGAPASRLCGCPPSFDAIIARATNQNPNQRYSSAAELADDLDEAVKTVGEAANSSTNRLVLPTPGSRPAVTVARPPAITAAIAAGSHNPTATPGAAVARAQLQAQAQKKSPGLAIGIGCAVVGLLGIVMFAASGGGKGDDPNKRDSKEARAEKARKKAAREEREREQERSRQPKNPRKETKVTNRDKPDRTKKPKKERPDKVVKASPLAALKTLKPVLATGGRDKFPDGTEALAGSRFLVADQPMNWGEAKEWAEAHGAHLAILSSAADRKWFREKFPSDTAVWVGAGMAANDKWQWLDGKAASGVLAAQSGGRFLTLDSSSELRASSGSERFHVALQWRDDASNPATTREQLKRTAETISAEGLAGATYPVGTRSYTDAGSHFFAVPKASSWDEARKLAKASGGYLAVPSSKAESGWIRQALSDSASQADAVLWIGGYKFKAGDPWRWLTNEAWSYGGGWLGGAEPVGGEPGRIVLRLGADGSGGWVPNDGNDGAALGLLVEWSPPKQAATIASFDLDAWLGKTDSRFASLIQADIDDYSKEREALLARYVRNIERLGRKFASAAKGFDGKGKLSDEIRTAVKSAVREVEKNGKLIDEMPSEAPDDLHELQKKSEESLKEMDDEFLKKLSAHMANYTQGVAKQAAELAKNGFDDASTVLNERVATIDNDALKFLTVFGLEDPTGTLKPPPEPEEDEDEEGKDKKKKKPDE